MLLRLVAAECYKLVKRPRSYIGLAAITVIIMVIQMALYADGKQYWDFLTQSLSRSFEITGLDFNGNMVGFIILQTLIIQMPLLVALISGDIISGEVQTGTLRMMLTRPVSRSQIIAAKFIASELYVLLLIVWMGILAWLGSVWMFGSGDIVVLKSEELVIIRNAETTMRFLQAFFAAFLGLSVINGFAFLLSAFSENSITPIVAGMSTIMLFTIIGTFDLPIFDAIKPWLFTTHTVIWRNFFDSVPDWNFIAQSLWVLLIYMAFFYFVALWRFKTKDFTL